MNIAIALLVASTWVASDPPLVNPIELGTVRWHRDFDAGRTKATEVKKDLLMLFQEVPG